MQRKSSFSQVCPQRFDHPAHELLLLNRVGDGAPAAGIGVALQAVGVSDQRCAAAAAPHQPAQHKFAAGPDRRLCLLRVQAFELGNAPLCGVPVRRGDKRLVLAVGEDGGDREGFAVGVPANLSSIDGVLQDVGDAAALHPVAKAGAHLQGVELLCDLPIAHPGQKVGEDHLHQRRRDRVGQIPLILDAVAEGGVGQRLAAPRLLRHAAGHLLGEIDAVKLIHRLDDGLGDDRHLVVAQIFADRDDVDAQLLAQHRLVDDAVLPAAGKAGIFPDQDGVEGLGALFCCSNHPQKFGPLAALPPGTPLLLDKDPLLRQQKAVVFGVAANLQKLAVRGIFQLVVGRHADVSGGCPHKNHSLSL